MISRGVQELLELRIGNRIAVDVERFHREQMVVAAARRVFPGILHVQPDPVGSFDLDAGHLEIEFAGGHVQHARRVHGGRLGGRGLHHALRQEAPLVRKARQGHTRPLPHLRQRCVHLGGALRSASRQHRQNCAEAVGFDSEAQHRAAARDARLDLDAVPQIVVVRAFHMPHSDLLAAHAVFVAIDHRPQGAPLAGKARREQAVLQSRRVRLPVARDQQFRELALDIRDPP